MWNPFKAPLSLAATRGAVNTDVVTEPDNPMMTTQHSNTVYLDDAIYPDQTQFLGQDGASFIGDLNTQRPEYDSPADGAPLPTRVLQEPSSPSPDPQAFLNPAIGSVDLMEPRTAGGIAGHAKLNYLQGPVAGTIMDVWQDNFQAIGRTSPGSYGPVAGRTDADYSHGIAYAEFQQALSDYSTAASMPAQIAVV